MSGKYLSFDNKSIKRCFFTACNTVISQSWRVDNIFQLSLLESYCLPILTHVAAAVSFKVRQLAELNACWNSVYRRIFGFNRWESVKVFIQPAWSARPDPHLHRVGPVGYIRGSGFA